MSLHIDTSGSGPAVLFVHAGVADSRMWRGQMGIEGFKTVAFDKRGYGKTPWVPGPYSDTADCLAVLDQTDVASATIVGCSMGAATALDLAIDHPERVDRLVLVGGFPSGWVPPGGWEESELEEQAMAAAEARDFDRVVEIDFQMWLVGYGRDESEIDPVHKKLFFDMDRIPAITEAERSEHQTGFGKRLNDHLGDIDVPTLVIVGSHDEPLLIDAAHYLASQLGDQPAVVMPDAAHLPSLEQPERFNQVLLEFLRR